MNNNIQLAQYIRLWEHIPQVRRKKLGLLIFLVLVASFAEVVSIGAMLPFLTTLTNPTNLANQFKFIFFAELINSYSQNDILIIISVAFCFASIIAGLLRLTSLWFMTKLSFSMGSDLSVNIYNRTLSQPFSIHCTRNSSEVINTISTKTNAVIYTVIVPFLTFISSCIMLVIIVFGLGYINFVATIIAFLGFGSIYLIIVRLTRRRLSMDSSIMAEQSSRVIQILQEGLGGIRDILLDGNQQYYCEIYRDADKSLRIAQARNLFIGASPRFIVEPLGIIVIVAVAIYFSRTDPGVTASVPMLGCLALGAQRMLPLLQQAFGSWVSIKGGSASMCNVLEMLEQPYPQPSNDNIELVSFENCISLMELSFRYTNQTKWILNKINLSIPKGAKVGIIGISGGGKSTFLDLMMGLQLPLFGVIKVDGVEITQLNMRAWQKRIAHVPQVVYLSDSTIAENIAFGIPKEKIDYEKVKLVAGKAQLTSTIESIEGHYEAKVGERGNMLSGGQRQRIGIARALYKGADVLFFDEATSALDGQTENEVMGAIQNLGDQFTIFIVAHRISTLINCSKIIEVTNSGAFRDVPVENLSNNYSFN